MMAALAHVMGIVRVAAIAEAQIKVAVRSKNERAAVVVPVRLRHFQKNPFGREIGLVRIGLGKVDLAQNAAFGRLLTVVKIQQAIALELRVKGKGQQTFFILDVRPSGSEIEEGFGIFGAGVAREDEDFSVLLDDNESFGVIRDLLHPERAIKSEVRKSGCELKRWKSFSSTTSIKNRQKGEDETKAFGHVHARGK